MNYTETEALRDTTPPFDNPGNKCLNKEKDTEL
jgi:hypothetical protein